MKECVKQQNKHLGNQIVPGTIEVVCYFAIAICVGFIIIAVHVLVLFGISGGGGGGECNIDLGSVILIWGV